MPAERLGICRLSVANSLPAPGLTTSLFIVCGGCNPDRAVGHYTRARLEYLDLINIGVLVAEKLVYLSYYLPTSLLLDAAK
jgi:hypothetical protein